MKLHLFGFREKLPKVFKRQLDHFETIIISENFWNSTMQCIYYRLINLLVLFA